MKPYADTNFFTRWYLEMAQSPLAAGMGEPAERRRAGALPVSWLHRVEFVNALQLAIFQGRGVGQKWVTPEQAAAALAVFRDDLAQRAMLRAVALPTEDIERQCEELSLRHTARHGFRAYDLLHVASALLLGCDTFWSFDPKASRLAALEGLKVPRALQAE
jgi:predicted nucleic acid-binding protein